MKPLYRYGLILLAVVLIVAALIRFDRPQGAKGKSPALPLSEGISTENQLAQDLALSDPAVIEFTAGKRSEVFNVVEVGMQYTERARACAANLCRQVSIYNYNENETIAVIVDLDQRRVLDVLHQPGILPMPNARHIELATGIIQNAPEVIAELGRRPTLEEIYPMTSGLAGTDCGSIHPCLGAVFQLGDRFLWAHVDLTTETFAGIGWSPAPAEPGSSVLFEPEACTDPTDLARDGWSMTYSVTPSDGLRIDNVTFNGTEVLTSVKLAEWHADYGSSGFLDATGCTGSGGFPIFPYGPTQVVNIIDENLNVIGFDVIQDFRMGNWGQSCNYRYEQHNQFFLDGRFRIVGGAYGKGCGSNAIYRPLIRIDIAVDGDENDSFAFWTGAGFDDQEVEFWQFDDGPYTAENYAWRVMDTVTQAGFYIEPGLGQFGDGGRGDDAFIYVVRHHANQGDGDLGAVGNCCNDDFQQGPHTYINGESIAGENIVLWYVPQFLTDTSPGEEYCWTLLGEPNPDTYPCFGGPMFHPFGFQITPTVTPSPTATATATPTPTVTPTQMPGLDIEIFLPVAPKDW